MKTLYYDCFAGISGDMNLGAMLDLGVDKNTLLGELQKLNVGGWQIKVSRDSRRGIFGTRAEVLLEEGEGADAAACAKGAEKSRSCEGAEARAKEGEGSHAHEHAHEHSNSCGKEHSNFCGDGHAHEHSNPCEVEHRREHEHSCECEHPHEHEHFCKDEHEHSCSGAHAHSFECSHEHEHSDSCNAKARHNLHSKHEHRHFSEIKKIIESSAISERAKALSLKIFQVIAEAEAKVHNAKVDDVCFHEVGALDSIIDIVAAAVCADLLGIDKFACSAIELGGGTVRCAHGLMPVPAPATAEILRGLPVKLNGTSHEATTPTGAAIVAGLCENFGGKLEGKILASASGIGARDPRELPNILRVYLIESGEEPEVKSEKMSVLEANIDDMTSEEISHLCERLFAAGASDVWQEAISMKKSRLAAKVCALASAENFGPLLKCFFENSSTLGIRASELERYFLERRLEVRDTSLGKVAFKFAKFGASAKLKPEFEDCRRIAIEKSMPLSRVVEIVKNEARD